MLPHWFKQVRRIFMQPAPGPDGLWGLAAGGPLSAMHSESFTALGSRYKPETCRKILADWWEIHNREDVFPRCDGLHTGGHTAQARELIHDFADAPPPDDRIWAGKLRCALKYKKEILERGLRGWDLGRVASVARWSHTAGFISAAEAWNLILKPAPLLRREYDSWQDYGEAWRIGFAFYNAGEPDDDFAQKLDWMQRNSASPWKKIPWNPGG